MLGEAINICKAADGACNKIISKPVLKHQSLKNALPEEGNVH